LFPLLFGVQWLSKLDYPPVAPTWTQQPLERSHFLAYFYFSPLMMHATLTHIAIQEEKKWAHIFGWLKS
jgi:hypothetical protein